MTKSLRRSFLYSLLSLLAFVVLLLPFGCDDLEDFTTDPSVKLEFSVDTLHFDTVFTELGSATRSFKVYNRANQALRISNIRFAGAGASVFRMNVDGEPGAEIEDVEVWANDSIYVFVEVTIDPDQPVSISPFVIEDRILFETNGNEQSVLLEAWGQNANYFPSRFNQGVPVTLTCNGGRIVWDDPKPYVLFGEIFIDDCTLEIAAGTRIHVHGGITQNEVFGVFNDGILATTAAGTLEINGTVENPVTIEGDRLEEGFSDLSGQWYGIIFGKNSTGNKISYATIKNSFIGMYVDSAAQVQLEQVSIHNTAFNNIIGYHSNILADNCAFYNANGTGVQLVYGGDYTFRYCTFASYGVNASALGMGNSFCFDNPRPAIGCEDLRANPLNASFVNCILAGSSRDEIVLSDATGGQNPDFFNVNWTNCIVMVDELLEQQEGLYADFFSTRCVPCINADRGDTLFLDVDEDDYQLDSLSIARNIGVPISGIQIDRLGMPRDPNTPDVGCFERID